jgi:hypothetical protein
MEELTIQEKEILIFALQRAAAAIEPAFAIGYGIPWRSLIRKLGLEPLIGSPTHDTDSGAK